MLLELSNLSLRSGSHSIHAEFDIAGVVSVQAEGNFVIE